MIYDHIENYKRYCGCSGRISKALDFIVENKSGLKLKEGIYNLDEDNIIAHVISVDTKDESEGELEIHKQYIDLHYLVKGKELCGFGDTVPADSECSYDENNDIAFIKGIKEKYYLEVSENEFYIVWPHESHKPLIKNKNYVDNSVKKIIIKIRD